MKPTTLKQTGLLGQTLDQMEFRAIPKDSQPKFVHYTRPLGLGAGFTALARCRLSMGRQRKSKRGRLASRRVCHPPSRLITPTIPAPLSLSSCFSHALIMTFGLISQFGGSCADRRRRCLEASEPAAPLCPCLDAKQRPLNQLLARAQSGVAILRRAAQPCEYFVLVNLTIDSD